MADASPGNAEPWFTGRDGEVLIYKINRRPLAGDPQLFVRPPLLEHLEAVLSGGHFAITGRRYQRRWRVGDREVIGGEMTGLIGWSRAGDVTPGHTYDAESESWKPESHVENHSAVSPFAVIADGHYLGVLRHPSFTPDSIAAALDQLLEIGETTLSTPTTEWRVEPVGNEPEFMDWLTRMDRVSEVKFVFRRPNPDGAEAFNALFGRLDRLNAEQIEQTVKQHDESSSLDPHALTTDPELAQFLAAAMEAYGAVSGQGYRGGKRTSYSQQDRVLTEPVESLGSDWAMARKAVVRAVRSSLRRRGKSDQSP